MKANSIPEDIGTCLSYDPETGLLRKSFGTVGSRTKKGYLTVNFDGVTYRAHRVIHFLMTGRQLGPDECIDHINRDPSDNRWCNLRVATDVQNRAYTLRTAREVPVGVEKRGPRYRAKIGRTDLGTFRTPEEASEAYQQAFNLRYGSEWNISSLAA